MPVWKRPEILKLVINSLNNFVENNKNYKFSVVYIVSPEDPDKEKIDEIVKNTECRYIIVFFQNTYVGAKMNAGISAILNEDYDYIMNCGSDDLLNPLLMRLLSPCIEKKTPFFGIDSVYFLDYKTNQAAYFQHYNIPFSVGAGRMIAKEVINKCFQVYGYLYTPEKHRALDTDSSKRIKTLSYNEIVINAGHFPYIVDVKSETNINSFEEIRIKGNCKTADFDIIKAEHNI